MVANPKTKDMVTWYQWTRKPVTERKKYMNFIKDKQTGTYTDLLNTFNKKLEKAVWDHLGPVIQDVLDNQTLRPKTLHMISDGPVTQYRNKKKYFLVPPPSFQDTLRSPGTSLKDPTGNRARECDQFGCICDRNF